MHATGHTSLSSTKHCPILFMQPDTRHFLAPNIVRTQAYDRTLVTFKHQTLSYFIHATGHASLSSTKHCPTSCMRPDTRNFLVPNIVRLYSCNRTRVTFEHQTLSEFMHMTGQASLSSTKHCPTSFMRPDMRHFVAPNIVRNSSIRPDTRHFLAPNTVRLHSWDRTRVNFEHQTLSEFMHMTGQASLSSSKHCTNSCIRPDTFVHRAVSGVMRVSGLLYLPDVGTDIKKRSVRAVAGYRRITASHICGTDRHTQRSDGQHSVLTHMARARVLACVSSCLTCAASGCPAV